MTYKEKYLEYKLKYLELKKLIGGEFSKEDVNLIIFLNKTYLVPEQLKDIELEKKKNLYFNSIYKSYTKTLNVGGMYSIEYRNGKNTFTEQYVHEFCDRNEKIIKGTGYYTWNKKTKKYSEKDNDRSYYLDSIININAINQIDYE